MPYNQNILQSQLQDLSRQYAQLMGQSQAVLPFQAQQQIPIPPRQIQYVEGIAGARLYQDGMPANSSEIIVDKDEDIFYKVSKDANGIPSKKIIRCGFTVMDDSPEEPTYLTRKDLDDFKEEIRQMLTQRTPAASSSTTKKTGDNRQ